MSTGEPMSLLIVLATLSFLMLAAYRGHSVILMAPVAVLGAVLLTDPALVAPMITGLLMDKMVGFLKLYFPVFLLGALFGKLIDVTGFSRSIVAATINVVGRGRAILRSEEHTSELQSRGHLVCRLLLEKKNNNEKKQNIMS